MDASNETGRGSAVRFAWLDYVRGMSVFCVVFNHTIIGLLNSGVIENTVVVRAWREIVYAFSMPTFFFITGMFLPRFLGRPMSVFWIDRLRTIVYPYVVWVVLFSFVDILAPEGKTWSGSHLTDIWLLVVRGPWHLWFLYTLLWTSIFYIVLRRLGIGPGAMIGVAVVMFLMARFSVAAWAGPLFPERYVEVMSRWTPYHWQGLYRPSVFMLYAALGGYLGRESLLMARVGHMPTLRLAGVFVASISALAIWSYFGVRGAGLARPLAATLGGSAVICAAVVLERKKWLGSLEKWGRRSLEIYVAHVIFVAVVRTFLIRYLNFQIGIAHLALGTAAGIYGSIAMYYVCARYNFHFVFALKPRAPTTVKAGASSTGGAIAPSA